MCARPPMPMAAQEVWSCLLPCCAGCASATGCVAAPTALAGMAWHHAASAPAVGHAATLPHSPPQRGVCRHCCSYAARSALRLIAIPLTAPCCYSSAASLGLLLWLLHLKCCRCPPLLVLQLGCCRSCTHSGEAGNLVAQALGLDDRHLQRNSSRALISGIEMHHSHVRQHMWRPCHGMAVHACWSAGQLPTAGQRHIKARNSNQAAARTAPATGAPRLPQPSQMAAAAAAAAAAPPRRCACWCRSPASAAGSTSR